MLAWMRQRFPNIVHIAGARGRQHVLDCAQARSLELSLAELDQVRHQGWNLTQKSHLHGSRYPDVLCFFTWNIRG